MAITDAEPALVVKFKSMGKSRLGVCGTFAAWSEQSTSTTDLDAPPLRLMLSLAASEDSTWSSVDVTSAFLNAEIHDEDIVLVAPPPILVKMNIVKPNTVWQVKKAIDGLRVSMKALWLHQMAKRGIKFT